MKRPAVAKQGAADTVMEMVQKTLDYSKSAATLGKSNDIIFGGFENQPKRKEDVRVTT